MEKLLTNTFFKQTISFFVVVSIAFALLLGVSKVAKLYAEDTGAELFNIINETN